MSEDTQEATEVSFGAARARASLIAEMGKKAGFVRPEGVHNGGSFVLKDIETLKDLFQPREEFEGHTKDLMDALKRNGALDPILVGWTGKRAVLIEGHHRHAAYERSGYKPKPVAVEWFVGSVNEAVSASMALNSKFKLNMTTQDKLNAAWRLIRPGGFSRAQIVRDASIGDGQVSRMRRVLKAHYEDVISVDTWAKASRIASGKNHEWSESELEEKLRLQVTAFKERMFKEFGNKLSTQPDMMAHVLESYCGRNLPNVFEACKAFGYLEREDEFDPEADF
jgi:ParB-like nuclease domain